jgi:hypothetical protein
VTALELKVGVHVHIKAPWDSGQKELDEIVNDYKSQGYDALVLTPHQEHQTTNQFDYFTIIDGQERLGLKAGITNWHILEINGSKIGEIEPITILAHPEYTKNRMGIFPPPINPDFPKTDFIEVFSNGVLMWNYKIKNAIPGENYHGKDDEFGCTFILLSVEDNTETEILKALYKAKRDGQIKWGIRMKDGDGSKDVVEVMSTEL